jgi:hypothetical protein
MIMRLLATLILILMPLSLGAQQSTGFGFYTDERNPPKGFFRTNDPTGIGPTRKVDVFTIPEGYCNPEPYESGLPDSDCSYQSSRAQRAQDGKSQPSEAWYGWWMYLPADFPYGRRQTRGHMEFAYWHNGRCPHITFANDTGESDQLYIETNRALGGYDCATDQKLAVASFSELVGQWTQFEVFIRWGDVSSGHLTVYLNGEKRVDRDMATLTIGFEDRNYFKYGMYICCTKDVATIRPMQLYFAGVKRSTTREGLALR